jgi:hypothetical protein
VSPLQEFALITVISNLIISVLLYVQHVEIKRLKQRVEKCEGEGQHEQRNSHRRDNE